MNLKFSTLLIGLSTLLFLQTKPLVGQIPASDLPPPGTDTGLEGKYETLPTVGTRTPANSPARNIDAHIDEEPDFSRGSRREAPETLRQEVSPG